MLSTLSDNFGSILVAVVSVITVLATNWNATRMRQKDAKNARELEELKHQVASRDRLYEERRDALFDFQSQAVLAINELHLNGVLAVLQPPSLRNHYDYGAVDCASYRAQTYCSSEGAKAAKKLRMALHAAPHARFEGQREVTRALNDWNAVIPKELGISPPAPSKAPEVSSSR